MKALLAGFIFLFAVAVLAGIGILIFPLLLILALLLRILISLTQIIFAVWLLGKFIIFVWEKAINGL